MAVETLPVVTDATPGPAPLLTHEAERWRDDATRRARLLVEVLGELRVIDQRTCSTFDGHGIRALMLKVEAEVSRG